jgi:hypothetical protein
MDSDILYKHIEFFFSKDDLHSMLVLKPMSYDPWLNKIYDMYSKKPTDNSFHYNIMHTDEYQNIKIHLKEIKEISKNSINGLTEQNIYKLDVLFKKIEDSYKLLYYYDEIYLYAHYVFNNIRTSDVMTMQSGGGQITLEEFKQKIRDKIKQLSI